MNRFFDETRGDLLVLLAALIWGVAFYFQKTAMFHIGPLLFLALRSVIAVIALLPFALVEQRRSSQETASIVPFAMLGGLVFFLAGSIQQFGIVTATVINAGLLTALYVVATPFAFWAVRRTAPPSNIWLSVGLAFVGIWCLNGGSVGDFSTGDMLIAGAALLWGVHIVVTGEAGRLAQPLTYTCIQFAVVAVASVSLAVSFEPIALDAIFDAAESILYVGLLSSAFTYGMMAIALRHIPAPRASVLLSFETVFSATAGYVLLGERLTPMGWAGASLILAAVFVVRIRGALAMPAKRPRSPL